MRLGQHVEEFKGLLWFGGHSASKTPGPIPNPAVKCCCADGTAS